MTDIPFSDWDISLSELNRKGYSLLPNFLSTDTCEKLSNLYHEENRYRKTVIMERHRFGLGEYKYFKYPLPQIIATIRSTMYPKLVPLANHWMKSLNINITYPKTLVALTELCKSENQTQPTPLILKYGPGGYNTLHQDLYGKVYFPIQLVLFLSEYGVDYEGGEFILTEQVPRAQSKALVLKPKKGDALLLTTNFRPIQGARGHYRVTMKHGVSEVTRGSRHTLGIIFHDATS